MTDKELVQRIEELIVASVHAVGESDDNDKARAELTKLKTRLFCLAAIFAEEYHERKQEEDFDRYYDNAGISGNNEHHDSLQAQRLK